MIFKYYNKLLANTTAILMLLMMINVFTDVVLRYFFHTGSIASQEMEWHLFSVMFLLGISYALSSEDHVRVDFIYDNLNKRKKAIINIFGTIFMLIPFAFLIAYTSFDFVNDAYIMNEISEDPGGLTHRWIIKAMIPASFVILIISSLFYIKQNILKFKENL
jgi:TRAP-type mannitol/chloroaromatic compound transport system permease small subunit